MGNNRPVKTKCFIKFLAAHGCERKGHKKHEKWSKPGIIRPIMFWSQKKEVPFIHIKTNMNTLGIDISYFYQWIDENC